MWKYIDRNARQQRIKALSSRMFARHQIVYEALLREGTYNSKEPTVELIKARYWLLFAQKSYGYSIGRDSGKYRFSCDVRWHGVGTYDDFDRLNDKTAIKE